MDDQALLGYLIATGAAADGTVDYRAWDQAELDALVWDGQVLDADED